MPDPSPESPSRPHANMWLIAVTVSMATFMEVLDTSIANVSLRHIAGNLAAGQDESTWVLTSYLVANAIILPISGWLATRIGRKKFYMGCVAAFTIASFMCGIAPSLGFLIVCRIIQGAGGGGLAPSEQAILTDTFPPAKRGAAFALYGVAVVVAPAVGPVLGGWITDNYSWRWIFLINIPVGILSLVMTHFIVPEMDTKKDPKAKGKIDYLGFGLVALGLGSLQIVLDRGQIDDWFSSPMITILTIVCVVSLVVFVIHEFTVSQPVVDLPLLKDRSFFVSNIAMFMLGAILFGTTQLIPQLMQDLLGYNATTAGLVLSPGGVMIMLLMPLVGFLVNKVQPKYLISFGFLTTAAALYWMTNFDLNLSYKEAAWARIFQTVGLAFLFVPINTIAYAGIPKNKSNNASALVNLMRNLGGSVGISISTTMLARRSQFHQERLTEHTSNLNYVFWKATHFSRNGGPGSSLRSIGTLVGQQAAILSYIDIFYVGAIAAAGSVLIALFIRSVKPGQKPQGH